MAAEVSLFGIRHHGPGSARRLVEALDALRPATVLIEGPADASHLLPMLADPAMATPVALLTYAEDDPARASFFPFANYSPEYQAARWAVAHGAALRFIDLPASDRLGEDEAERDIDEDPIARDPIGVLATAAGYDDGESWWADVIEENPASTSVFTAVAEAMTALRAEAGPLSAREAAREAHMRIEIARAAKESEGPVAVVCGAWHVPALAASTSLTADRALLKGRPKAKIKATWAPWTAPRLARASGYGAGVVAPGWCAHLWDTRHHPDRDAVWLARIAWVMRERGHAVSTASVIEAQRLGHALAALRERPHPGFEELREAAIACLCHGERARWDDIAAELLVGSAVGVIPADTPLAPLLEDLQRQQKATRLKPEALERNLTLDLRSESGLARSTLLHRLNALDVPWGALSDAGRSRGTFRENWIVFWDPEYAVRLVENLVHGSTIADAAAGRLREAMAAEPDLGELAGLVRSAMIADLPQATETGIALLERRAALTSDGLTLLTALPPMADILRYGEARSGTTQHLGHLMPRIVVQAALTFPYAARHLDAEAAGDLRAAILAADGAIQLAQLDADIVATWHEALGKLVEDDQVTRLVAGTAARLLYEAEKLAAQDAATLLARMLSPGTPIAEAAGFFEGFLEGAGERLIHDQPLREAVDGWLSSLDEDSFVASLPLFRRVFSALDRSERRRLMDATLGRIDTGARGYVSLPGAAALWPAHEARVLALMTGATP
ncbi:DUF5682 family protein [Sphingomonas sanguinis]|jgi:hypothetical protein|uniref:Uncharacterized protein n=1 Tax=Sphingomonas sanguinis TaxID=33051 RepID=A0A7Y7UQT5_9SPHN|nr:DUF5682 family protein [Sphingomonas sanguinis]MBZ6382005.1 DUF5682 family protein [Sphingomonas sanguinis]NNG50711.1 hypothetical protein [Sphingomonas sanguinis]NNG52560.1 hypothetical protein [Sphingomonas sanguinis]NVP31304.1 hypothetical protein [Sphingomonas sanguinis]